MRLPSDITAFLSVQTGSRLPRSLEFKFNNMCVYLRSGEYINGECQMRMRAAEVSRIDIDPKMQNKGLCREFLAALEKYALEIGYHYVRVAQVHNMILRDALVRYGYEPFQDIYVKHLVGAKLTIRQQFEQAIIDNGYTAYELAMQFVGGRDTDPVVADRWFWYREALRDRVSVQEAWEASGGNPGIKATREELLSTLRMMSEAEDEWDDRK